ncbi:MAG: ABC transporter substrate-binding protein [Rhodospirillales bacterium]|nr:ABC transporter substrate-binding protein [Rhodospirillales bacterium]
MLVRLVAGLAAGLVLASSPTFAQNVSDRVVKIGVLNDMSGVYSASSGPGTVESVKMAVEDFGSRVLGMPVEVVAADHQNRPDVGSSVVNEWFDIGKVDAVVDVPTSSVALAVNEIARNKNRVFIAGGAATTDLTNKACSATTVHYIYDSYALASAAAKVAVERLGKTFFFLTVDYAFGQQLQDGTTAFLNANGGKVVGAVKHPLGTNDFASFMLQAQASKADVIVLANAAGDTANALKTAKEFGIIKGGQKMLTLLIMDPDVHGLGLETAQGLTVSSAFFWNRTPETIAWSRRYFQRTGKMPSFVQAGAYSYTTHYLNAIKAAGTDEAKAVVAKMKELPVNDFFAKGVIRPDGLMVHDMYLVQVKSPAESREPWDYFKLVDTVPGEKAFKPLERSDCPLVKKN